MPFPQKHQQGYQELCREVVKVQFLKEMVLDLIQLSSSSMAKTAYVPLSGHSSFRDDLQDQTDFYAIQSSCGKGRAYQLLVLDALLALAPSQKNSRNNNI